MDSGNDVITKAMIFISSNEEEEERKVTSDDEILAAQGLLELSQVIRRFYDNIVSTNTIGAVNKHNHPFFPPIPVINRTELSNYQRFPTTYTYMPTAKNLPAISVNPIDGEAEGKPSPSPAYYSPYAVPMHQLMMPMDPSATRWERAQILPPLLPYISSHLVSSSQEEEEGIQFAVVKQEERQGNEEEEEEENEDGDGEWKMTRKRKFYINQTSKEREADISYHHKKLDVRMKMERYRSE